MAFDVFKFATGQVAVMNRSEVQYLCEAKVGGYNRSTALFTPSNIARCRYL
jgi:hypothetical protein